MKKIITFSFLAVLLIGLTGCTSAKFTGLQVTKAMPSYEVIGEFETSVVVVKYLGMGAGPTLVNIGAENTADPVYQAIQDQIAELGGDAAVNVDLTYGATAMQVVLNSITGNLYAPGTVTITGSVVKY